MKAYENLKSFKEGNTETPISSQQPKTYRIIHVFETATRSDEANK